MKKEKNKGKKFQRSTNQFKSPNLIKTEIKSFEPNLLIYKFEIRLFRILKSFPIFKLLVNEKVKQNINSKDKKNNQKVHK